jgi:hypothetical protein
LCYCHIPLQCFRICLSLGTVSEMSKVSFLTDNLVAQSDFIVFSHNENLSDFMKCFALTDRVLCMHTKTHTHHGVCTITRTHIDFNALFARFKALCKNLNYSFCFWTSIMLYLVIYLNSGFITRTFHNRCMLHSDVGQVFVHVLGFSVPVTNSYMLRLICHLHCSAQQVQLVSSGLSHCLSFASLPVLCHYSGL